MLNSIYKSDPLLQVFIYILENKLYHTFVGQRINHKLYIRSTINTCTYLTVIF